MRRAAIPAIFLPTLLLLVSAQVALAARPADHFVSKIDETFDEELCGIPVTTRVSVNANVLEYQDKSVRVLDQVRATWTNADGDWLQLFIAGQFRVQFEEADGLLTITETISGVQRLRSAAGITAAFERGRIVNVIVIELHPPDGPEGDVFVSFETVFLAGPHPGGGAFCGVVTDVLG